jgi:hypothetical protein
MITKVAGLLLLIVAELNATESTKRFITSPESNVIIAGMTTIHSWQITSREVEGWFESPLDFPVGPAATPRLEKVATRAEVSVPVISLKSDLVTARTAQRLLSEKTPAILYTLTELVAKAADKSDPTTYRFNALVSLVAAGVTNQISIPVHLTKLDGGRLKIVGTSPVKLSAFGIKSPSILPSPDSKNPVSEIKLSEDEVQFSFEWFLKPAPRR